MSKSELKRLCVQNPLKMAEELAVAQAEIERLNSALCGCDDMRRELQQERDSLLQQVESLKAAIVKTLDENGHLADGDNCTLIDLKRVIEGANSVPAVPEEVAKLRNMLQSIVDIVPLQTWFSEKTIEAIQNASAPHNGKATEDM